MTLTLVTAPSTEPFELAEAKAFLRVDVDDENTYISALITAARVHCENFTHRAFVTQAWDYKLDGFPCDGGAIWLPKAPLLAGSPGTAPVVTYTDSDGATQTFSSSLYTVDAPTGPHARMGRLFLNYGEQWPATRAIENAVQVRYSAGYGAAAAVPEPLKVAMKMLIGHWYATREAAQAGGQSKTPENVDALLWPFKSF